MEAQKGYIPVSLLGLVFVMLVLPIAVFLVGQQQVTQDVRSRASEGGAQETPRSPGAYLVADTYVDSDIADKNVGNSPVLWADGSSVKITYLKFDLSSLAGKKIISAKLRLKVNHSSEGPEMVKAVADSSWEEMGMTYFSKPALGAVVASIAGGQAGNWAEVDVTSYVAGKEGQKVSLGIDSANPNGLGFNSREAQGEAPELKVSF